MRINNDQASSGLAILIGVFIVIHSFRYDMGSLTSPGTGFMPLLTGMAIILLALIGLVCSSVQGAVGGGWNPILKGVKWGRPAIAIVFLFSYALLVDFLGFILTTILFITLLLRVLEHQRWPLVITWAVLSSLASYAIFEIWLKAQLPMGILGF